MEEEQIFDSYKNVNSTKSVIHEGYGKFNRSRNEHLLDQFHNLVEDVQDLRNMKWWEAVEYITCVSANKLMGNDPNRCLAAEYVQKRYAHERGAGVDTGSGIYGKPVGRFEEE